MEGDIVQMQEIFKFVRTGTGADGTVIGHFQATGVRPRFLTTCSPWASRFPAAISTRASRCEPSACRSISTRSI